LEKSEIARTFLKAWHPLLEWEQLSLQSLSEAIRYWKTLIPLEERWKETPPLEVAIDSASREELVRQKVLRDIAFSEELENFWKELKTSTKEKGREGKIRYWDFLSFT
jgi:hypothetical protein